MLTSHILQLNSDGSQTAVVTCRLTGSIVECEGQSEFVRNLQTQGIRVRDTRGNHVVLFPEDGMPFLRGLQQALSSGYLMATEPREE